MRGGGCERACVGLLVFGVDCERSIYVCNTIRAGLTTQRCSVFRVRGDELLHKVR